MCREGVKDGTGTTNHCSRSIGEEPEWTAQLFLIGVETDRDTRHRRLIPHAGRRSDGLTERRNSPNIRMIGGMEWGMRLTVCG